MENPFESLFKKPTQEDLNKAREELTKAQEEADKNPGRMRHQPVDRNWADTDSITRNASISPSEEYYEPSPQEKALTKAREKVERLERLIKE